MSASSSPGRNSLDSAIQEKQDDIDRLDTKLDSKVDLEGMSDDQKEQLKNTYVDKINLFQGIVERSLEQINLQRNTGSSGWREWEDQVLGVEKELYGVLNNSFRVLRDRESKEENAVALELSSFNQQIDDFMLSLEQGPGDEQEGVSLQERLDVEKPQPLSTQEIFSSWMIPAEGLVEKAQRALENYGEDEIQELACTISLYEALSPELREELFGVNVQINYAQVAGQLANGTFDQSPLAFLLTEGLKEVEKKVLMKREELEDGVDKVSQEISKEEEKIRKSLARLCQTVDKDVSDGTAMGDLVSWALAQDGHPEVQKQVIDYVNKLNTKVKGYKEDLTALQTQVFQIGYALNRRDTTGAHNAGRQREEAQLRFNAKVIYGQAEEMSSDLFALLRPAQREMWVGNHEAALRKAVDSFNWFLQQNPDYDVVNRCDVLDLLSARKRKKQAAKFETFQVQENPLVLAVRQGGSTLSVQTTSPVENMFGVNTPKTETALTELGTLPDGSELILIQLTNPYTQQPESVVAMRGVDGQVRLQDGTVVENPQELESTRLAPSGSSSQNVYLTPAATQLLQKRVQADPDERIVLRAEDSRGREQLPVAVLGVSDFQRAVYTDDDRLQLLNGNGVLEQEIDAGGLHERAIEQGQDLLMSIDHNPAFQSVASQAAELQGSMTNMQTMLEGAMGTEASLGDEYVDQLHGYAGAMLGVIENKKTQTDVKLAKAMLEAQLKRVQFGSYVGSGIESAIRERISTLDDYLKILEPNEEKNSLIKVLHSAQKVTSGTWGYWLSTDGVVMIASIVAAVAAITAFTVITGGAGLVAISAVGAAGGLIGGELAREGLYLYEQTLGGASRGEYRYEGGSSLGDYARGREIIDPQTGELVPMSFLEHVMLPYTKQFMTGFVMCFAACGLGQIAGKFLSKVAQNSKLLQAIGQKSSVVNYTMTWLSKSANKVAKLPAGKREVAKKIVAETLDELGDEGMEGVLGAGLSRVHPALGGLATFLVATGKGFKPMSVDGGSAFSYPSDVDAAEVRRMMEVDGHTVLAERDGAMQVRTFDGHDMSLQPDGVGLVVGGREAPAVTRDTSVTDVQQRLESLEDEYSTPGSTIDEGKLQEYVAEQSIQITDEVNSLGTEREVDSCLLGTQQGRQTLINRKEELMEQEGRSGKIMLIYDQSIRLLDYKIQLLEVRKSGLQVAEFLFSSDVQVQSKIGIVLKLNSSGIDTRVIGFQEGKIVMRNMSTGNIFELTHAQFVKTLKNKTLYDDRPIKMVYDKVYDSSECLEGGVDLTDLRLGDIITCTTNDGERYVFDVVRSDTPPKLWVVEGPSHLIGHGVVLEKMDLGKPRLIRETGGELLNFAPIRTVSFSALPKKSVLDAEQLRKIQEVRELYDSEHIMDELPDGFVERHHLAREFPVDMTIDKVREVLIQEKLDELVLKLPNVSDEKLKQMAEEHACWYKKIGESGGNAIYSGQEGIRIDVAELAPYFQRLYAKVEFSNFRNLPLSIQVGKVEDLVADICTEGEEDFSAIMERTNQLLEKGSGEHSLASIIERKAAVCRHRALLFKLFSDRLGWNARVRRGYVRVQGVTHSGTGEIFAGGGHAWNEVIGPDGTIILADATTRFRRNGGATIYAPWLVDEQTVTPFYYYYGGTLHFVFSDSPE